MNAITTQPNRRADTTDSPAPQAGRSRLSSDAEATGSRRFRLRAYPGMAGARRPRFGDHAGMAGARRPRLGDHAGMAGARRPRLGDHAGMAGARPGRLSGRLGVAAAVAGIAYTLSWVAGLTLPVPNLAVTATGADVIARYGDHLAAVQAQFALTEGLPAIGLAVVAALLALAARRAGARRLSVAAAASGGIAAVISLTQYALGVALTGWALPSRAPGPVAALFEAVNRLDGAKMLALAVLGITAAVLAGPGGPLPRWLRVAGLALAVAITVSGMGYLLLLQALAPMAYPAGALLLIFVTGAGVALGGHARASAGRAGSPGGQAREDGGCPGPA